MIKLTCLWLSAISTCLLCSAVSAKELPDDWSKTYVAQEWRGKCEVPGRGGCREGKTYYYDSDKGISVNFISYDQKNIRLIVASSEGLCANGTLSIQGVSEIQLGSSGDYCTVIGGKLFREAENITNIYSQLDIGMFRKASTIEIDIELSNGEKQNAEITMQGFSEKLDAARNYTP